MLSQYSWWDFFKVVLTGTAIYYAYVLWTYYRQDIREWLTNRSEGGKTPEAVSVDDDEDDVDSLYTTSRYGTTPPVVQQTETPTMAVAAPEAAPIAESPVVPLNLSGHVIGDDEPAPFTLALAADVIRPQEQSLDEVINTAKRIQQDEQGVMTATDAQDEEAKRLATIINQQRGVSPSLLDGVSFKR